MGGGAFMFKRASYLIVINIILLLGKGGVYKVIN